MVSQSTLCGVCCQGINSSGNDGDFDLVQNVGGGRRNYADVRMEQPGWESFRNR